MPSGIEIERKFLVAEAPPDLASHPSERIDQGYLAIGEDGVEVRIRSYGERSFLTVKAGSGQVRVEEEIEIDARRFRSLWPLTEGRRISKRRYLIPAAIAARAGVESAATIELDVYDGALAGLLTAEIEFDSPEAAAAFTPPAWLGRDITAEAGYKNQRLALDGLPGT